VLKQRFVEIPEGTDNFDVN
jgi:hypothetical protein